MDCSRAFFLGISFQEFLQVHRIQLNDPAIQYEFQKTIPEVDFIDDIEKTSHHDLDDMKNRYPNITVSKNSTAKNILKKVLKNLFFSHIPVILATIFVAESSRGIILPTALSCIQTVGGNVPELAYSISFFFIGRLIASLIFGYWADYRHSSREALIFGTIFSCIGNLLYSFTFLGSVYVLYCSRLLVGFGSGILGVCRSFLAGISSEQDRTKYMAWTGLVQ